MAHPKETRDAVRRAYVHDRQSLEMAAAMHGVASGTARRWKLQALEAGDDWDKAQSAQLLAGGGIEDVARQVLAGLVTQFQATMEAVQQDENIKPATKVQMLASLADAYNKTVSASKRVLPETSALATAMEVLQYLAAFIREQFPQHAHAFAEVLEPFGEAIARKLA
jgi:transposase-like protein